jgi:hypothetical protein
MSSVQEIELAIGKLSPRELEDLREWIDETYTQPIDTRLKADVEAGRMDDRIQRALADYRA